MKDIGVLIIDDEKICIDEVKQEIDWKALDIAQDRIYSARSVRQAMSCLREYAVNIVICDIEMPNENGLDFIEWITEWVRFSENPVECIMLTCHPEYNFIRRALQLGCLDYVLKPMEAEELESSVLKAIKNIEERKEKVLIETHTTVTDTYEDIVYGKIIPYIEKNLVSQLSVDNIADYVSLNPQYMMRLFKKKTGKSILTYVTDLRMDFAKELLLKTDWSVEIITEKCGYLSYAHFSALFKRIEGVTPGQYRKKYRK